MNGIYWSTDSWGDAYPPENADDICSAANRLIDDYESHNPEDLQQYSNDLWEHFCNTEEVAGVKAIWKI